MFLVAVAPLCIARPAQAADWGREVTLTQAGEAPSADLGNNGLLNVAWRDKATVVHVASARANGRVSGRASLGRGGNAGLDIVSLSQGRSLAVWDSSRGVKAVTISASGRRGAVQALSGVLANDYFLRPVVQTPGGGALVTWELSHPHVVGQPTRTRLMAIRVDKAGRFGPSMAVVDPLGGQSGLAVTPSGESIVMFSGPTTRPAEIPDSYLRRVAEDGTLGVIEPVIPSGEEISGTPSMSLAPDGYVAVSWTRSIRDAQGRDFVASQPVMRWVAPDGTQGPVIALGPRLDDPDYPNIDRTIAFSGQRMFVISLRRSGLFVTGLSKSGLGPRRRLFSGNVPDVSVSSTGSNAVVAWQARSRRGSHEISSIYAALGTSGSFGRAQLVSSGALGEANWRGRPFATINSRGRAAVAFDVGGNFVLGVRAVFTR
jgi:hypothetical protein